MSDSITAARPTGFSIKETIASAGWVPLEEQLATLRQRVDASIHNAQRLRRVYRDELLADPALRAAVCTPTDTALERAVALLHEGTVAAADGTVQAVAMLGGSKIQVGVVIVPNTGKVVDLVTRVFEYELSSDADGAREFFSQLRGASPYPTCYLARSCCTANGSS